MTKLEMVKKHLLKKKSITSWEAIRNYKVTRLSAIIYELRKKGWDIKNKKITGEDSSFVKYVLIKAK
jgi:hypothetical protein